MNREWKRLILAVCCLIILTAVGMLLPDPPVAAEIPPVSEEPIVEPDPLPNPTPDPLPNPTPDPLPEEPDDPEGSNTDWNMILVNKQNPVSLSFEPEA